MSDIVDKLRTLGPDNSGFREIGNMAADEIERLRVPAQGAPEAKQCLDLAATFENAKRVCDFNPAIRELQSDFTFFDDECKLIAKALRHMAGATNGLAATALTEGSRGTVDLDADMAEHRFYRDALIEECAQIAEHQDRQMEWPALEQDGQRMSPTARMQQAIAAAIRATALPSTERCGGGQ